MKITWIGHSCFKVEKDGCTILLDPYGDGSVPGLAPVRERANMVLCSHEHGDHNARDKVEIVEAERSPFTVTRMETYHDDEKGAKRGRNIIHIISDNEMRIAHLGDLGCEPDAEQIKQLMGLDAVLIPVGGFYTINAVQAAKLVESIRPGAVIPMHYRSDEKGFGFGVIGTVDPFMEQMKDVMVIPTSELDLATTKDMPGTVFVLQPQNAGR
ncbi:MAG TPA: Zn-dependent hydrolase [Lachnospiraceae bacterium]|nr:Zn-dependent hydrolase [Lachnospiraceae bacterium]